MIQIPSFKQISEGFAKTVIRFPFAIGFAVFGSILLLILSENIFNEDTEMWLVKGAMACYVGMMVSCGLTLLHETLKKGTPGYVVSTIGKLLIPVAYFFSLPQNIDEKSTIRFILISLSLHMFVSFAPFIKQGQINGFWQFNKSIFIRILASVLYSGVLYVGISAAIGSVNILFNVNIGSKIYLHLFIIIGGIFNTIFFLSGIPEYFSELENETDYPKGLKIFTQFVLLPLVIIYLTILYAYELKIAVTFSLPKGLVSYLVIAFAIFGILALLLVHPIKNLIENKWIKLFATTFYIALIPLIALLFWAIGYRVLEYGVTENRYFVLVLAIWLAFIAVYNLINKQNNIKIIPISLAISALLASYGPFSAFSVSFYSQYSKLEKIITQNNIISSNKFENAKNLNSDDQNTVKEVVRYICDKHSVKNLRPIIGSEADSISNREKYKYNHANEVLRLLNIKVYENDDYNNQKNFSYYANEDAISVSGYDYWLSVQIGYNVKKQINLYGKPYTLVIDTANNLKIQSKDSVLISENLSPWFKEIANESINDNSQRSKSLTFEKIFKNNNCAIKINVNQLNGNINISDKALTVYNGNLYILFKTLQ